MRPHLRISLYLLFILSISLCICTARNAVAQEDEEPLLDQPGIFTQEPTAQPGPPPMEPAQVEEPAEPPPEEEEEPEAAPEEAPEEQIKVTGMKKPAEGEEGERRKVKIAGFIIASYVFESSPESFQVKYGLDLNGDLNASDAVIKGDASIEATVDGFLAKWPTGDCKLKVEIPKVPFEISFNKTDEEKGNLKVVFKQNISENWQSNCQFTDAPGAKFDTTGPPEQWLGRALKKAKPPLNSIVVDLKNEETTTQMVVPKQIIGDPPIGSMEIEGTLSATVSPPGGSE